jgi:hypothetical protein
LMTLADFIASDGAMGFEDDSDDDRRASGRRKVGSCAETIDEPRRQDKTTIKGAFIKQDKCGW